MTINLAELQSCGTDVCRKRCTHVCVDGSLCLAYICLFSCTQQNSGMSCSNQKDQDICATSANALPLVCSQTVKMFQTASGYMLSSTESPVYNHVKCHGVQPAHWPSDFVAVVESMLQCLIQHTRSFTINQQRHCTVDRVHYVIFVGAKWPHANSGSHGHESCTG